MEHISRLAREQRQVKFDIAVYQYETALKAPNTQNGGNMNETTTKEAAQPAVQKRQRRPYRQPRKAAAASTAAPSMGRIETLSEAAAVEKLSKTPDAPVVKQLKNQNTNRRQPQNQAQTAADNSPAAKQPTQKNNRGGQNRQRQRRKSDNVQAAVPLKLYPLGGLGEVGKNINIFECQGDMIMVDCGLVFPDSDMFGIDLVIPDFTFVMQNKERIKGVLITHGHEDHIGSLPYLLKQFNVPVYATRLSIGLIKNKLDEHGLTASAKLIEIQANKKIKLGCFTVEPFHVNHSIPDAVGFAITSPAGVVLHTGDFKIDYTPLNGVPTDLVTIGDYGKAGVLALMSDSTNSERQGFTATEQTVVDGLAKLFMRAEKKRIIIATFASNISRIQQIIDLAVKHDRKVAVSGRSMVKNTEMTRELGYLKIPETSLIEVDKLYKYPPEKVVLITTGSQGEPLSALSRMSSGSHRSVRVGEGDFIIISANPIPGNEKMVTKVVNGLLKLGAEVIYESMYDVHVSGHACQEEQKLMLTLAKPQFFLPVHGEYKQLKKHAETAKAVGIPAKNIYIGENGDCIELSKNGIKIGEPVQAGGVMVDGLGVGDVGNVVLRDRRHLSEDGLVIVVATVDSATGELLSGPDLVSRGFVYVRDSEELIDGARSIAQGILERLSSEDAHDWNSVKTRVREGVSSYLYRRTKRSPMILPILMEV